MPSTQFGISFEFVSDVDGDGCDEVVVGSPWEAGCPGVFLFRGRSGDLLFTLWDQSGVSSFGSAVCSVSDRDGDRVRDLAIASPFHGIVELYSTRDGHVLARLDALSDEREFGRSIVALGDLDGDGAEDLLVSACIARDGWTRRLVIFSSRDGRRIDALEGGDAVQEWVPSAPVARLGYVDGDPIEDFAVSERGRVSILSGVTRRMIREIGIPGVPVGVTLASAGDWDGDTAGDVAVSEKFALFRPGTTLGIFSARTGVALDGMEVRLWSDVRGFASVGDLDGDGRPETAFSLYTRASEEGLYVLYGKRRSDQNDVRQLPVRRDLGWLGTGWRLASGGDFDGDGAQDLLVGRRWMPSPDADSEENRKSRPDHDGVLVYSARTGAMLAEFSYSKLRALAAR